jgi:hypothetical protein
MSLKPYKTWLFCPECNKNILFGVDTDFTRQRNNNQLTHFCDGLRLYHNNEFSPIVVIQSPTFVERINTWLLKGFKF